MCSAVISGGPLDDTFQLDQVHGHWGEADMDGSEHYLDGLGFAGEAHFVHWNQDKYVDFNEAMYHEDGVCVIGVFYKVPRLVEEMYLDKSSMDDVEI